MTPVVRALIVIVLVFVAIFTGAIAYGAVYEVFIRRRPKLELAKNRRRRMLYLVHELEREIDDKHGGDAA